MTHLRFRPAGPRPRLTAAVKVPRRTARMPRDVCHGLLAVWLGCQAGCASTPVALNDTPPAGPVDGTVTGIVHRMPGEVAEAGRVILIVDQATGRQWETTTSTSGSFTMRLPVGTYRVTLKFALGDDILEQPGIIEVNASEVVAANFRIRDALAAPDDSSAGGASPASMALAV